MRHVENGVGNASSRILVAMPKIARPARDEGGLIHQLAVIVGVSVLSGVLIAGLALLTPVRAAHPERLVTVPAT